MVEGVVSPVPRGARPFQGRRAGLVSRMVAGGIDSVVVALILLCAYAGTAIFLFLVNPRGFSPPDLGLLFSLASAFVVLVVYQTLGWWLTGRTYGGRVLGLRMVGPGGRRLRLTGSLVRALFTAVFPVGILWVAMSRGNRSVQDVVLRTSVVYDWSERGRRSPTASGERDDPDPESGPPVTRGR